MFEEFENEKQKEQKSLTFRSRDLNPRFSVSFLPMILIFMESEEPEIKSKQASKRDKTLIKTLTHCTKHARACHESVSKLAS